MSGCSEEGGCPSDYLAVAVSILSLILLFTRTIFPFLVHKVPITKTNGFWLLIIQIVASFNILSSLVISMNFLKLERRHPWQSCYIWAVWVEGPLGFGLLMSCRIVQAFQLYYFFVKRRLPPVKSFVILPLILLPWIGAAAFLHMRKPLNERCHMRIQWALPVASIHALYIATLVGVTQSVRHIKFRFHEFKDLLQGIFVSTMAMGVWIAAYIINELHEEIQWLQVTTRFLLLVTASIFVIAFFSMSVSQPLLSQMSLRKREPHDFKTMGRALGIPESGLLLQGNTMLDIDLNEPLDKLLLNKKFRHSFMAFADSCLAGESLHFYEEVHELSKVPMDDPVRRVYMARHIIEKYIDNGAVMEVNISHKARQEILDTSDLTHPNLFNKAISELMQLMKMNLAKDYWSSMFFVKFKEESQTRLEDTEPMDRLGWDFSPRLSSVHGADDPFHQEHIPKGSDCRPIDISNS